MTNDEILAAAIRLIKAGKKEAARSVLEPFLLQNPNHIQAWMWEAELFPNDRDKIRVLESCLKQNPDNPQVTQALNFLKSRTKQPAGKSAATPVPTSPFTTEKPAASPFADSPARKPAPPIFTESPFAKPAPPPFSASPFSTSPFSSEEPPAANQEKAALQSLPPFGISEPDLPPPDKKTKRKKSKTKDIFIIAGACLLFALLAGGYVGGGFYLDGQIKNSFSAQKCEAVAQYAYFNALYPQVLFASAFTGYDRYVECQFKLDVAQAVKAKNWETTIELAQGYLAVYPDGVFAADMNKQIIGALTVWSNELIANQNYANGIEKLKQLAAARPDAPETASVQDDILKTYLALAKSFSKQKNYPEAEQNLKNALAYFEADAARAGKIKTELASVYVGWGDAQIDIGNIDNAVKYYQMAGEISQGKIDANLLIAKAYLKQALEIADRGDFNRALSKAQGIADAAQAENIKAEVNAARAAILKNYSNSTAQQAIEQITNAAILTCRGERPELPIFGLDKKNIRFELVTLIPMQLPKELSAETPGQLHYVACALESEKEIQTCAYKGGHSLTRLRYEWKVALYDVLTGKQRASNTFKGADPADCKKTEPFPVGVKDRKSYGAKPTLEQISAWLRELNLTE
ncbi:MAG: hypothetical protein PHQ36_06755 [Anaerolineales bacterium]|nr:hypothetical protein [Anaerolineales bacterium]